MSLLPASVMFQRRVTVLPAVGSMMPRAAASSAKAATACSSIWSTWPGKSLQSTCDHQGAHMKVVTVRDFRDHASEMFRSDDVVLVTREGTPAGFFLPWDTPELPVEVRREVFLRLSEQIGATLKAKDVNEQEVLGDFAASRSHS